MNGDVDGFDISYAVRGVKEGDGVGEKLSSTIDSISHEPVTCRRKMRAHFDHPITYILITTITSLEVDKL